jgi:DNA-directed RNA polymerase subunit alpha
MLIHNGDRLINTRNWSELVKPEQIGRAAKSTNTYAKFVCEPLERGFGTTIGNALRRVLLSSLQGAAIISVRIQGVQHEFTTIPGVQEDVTDLILNLKLVRFSMTTDQPQHIVLRADKKGAVTAAAIQENQNLRVLNPGQHIATLSEEMEFKIDLEVRMGKGYVPAEMHEGLQNEIGLIPLDASFSPVKKVAYTVEQARVGQMTNYDKLLMEVWTDGSVTPEDAVAYSAKILKDQLSVFINFDEHSSDEEKSYQPSSGEENPNLYKNIDELELSVRATNCLKSANIRLVGELVQKTENEMLKTKNFGRKSLEEIRRVLENMGLEFGMHVDSFDEKYQEWLKRKDSDEA